MKMAYTKGKELPPFKLAYTAKTFVKLQAFLPSFENIYQLQRQSMANQASSNKEYQEVVKKAKTYINHFLRVMNMAVQRGDFRQDTPDFFGLINGKVSLPHISTEKEIINWGSRIMEGEAKRIRAGRTPVTNPTIAVVRVHFENFMDAWQYQKTLSKRTADYSCQMAEMRKEADQIIVDIWNEVEETFSDLPEISKRIKAEAYGLVYVFRRGELEKIEAPRSGMPLI
ncbi:MAG TPA: hypothetical protein VMW76_06820 [Bacteroidales bacterium]|nr:hypothetical protein [Bacteroidales bacterium]